MSELRAIRLRGNLGNHLFQYGLLHGLGEHPAVVDTTIKSAKPLQKLLQPGAVRTLRAGEAVSLRLPPLRKGRRRLERHWPGQPKVYDERAPGSFDPVVRSIDGPVIFNGYFQNESYFDRSIIDTLAPAPPEAQAFLRVLPDDRPTVAVAVRAGADYQRLGWTVPPAWYRQAAKQIVSELGSVRFIVTSDVPQAADDMVTMLGDLGPGLSAATYGPAAQLHIVAGTDHAVIAASSFAWWGAWLGDPGRIVICPDPWVHPDFDGTPSVRWRRLLVGGEEVVDLQRDVLGAGRAGS